MTLVIYQTLEYREDHTKQLTEYGVVVPSDGENERQSLGSVIKVLLFKHSTNIITPTDEQ
jgi:hypothetical protein